MREGTDRHQPYWLNWHLFVYYINPRPILAAACMHAGSLHTCMRLHARDALSSLSTCLFFFFFSYRPAVVQKRAVVHPHYVTLPMRMRTGGPMAERGSRPQSGTHICIAYTCMCIPTWWPEPAGRRRHAYIRLMMPSHVHYACRPACSHMRSTIWYLIDGAKSPDVRTARTPRAPASTTTTTCGHGHGIITIWINLIASMIPPLFLVKLLCVRSYYYNIYILHAS